MTNAPVFQRPEFWATYGNAADYLERENFILASLPDGAKSLLDVGCGNGVLIQRIAMAGDIALVVGLDNSETALRNAAFPAVVGELPALPFRDQEFDVVLCLEVLEHIPEPAYSAAAAELARVAGLEILVGVPYREKLMTKVVACASCGMESHVEGHLRSFSEHDLSGLIPGWTLVSTQVLGKRVIRLADWISRFRRSFLGHSYLAQEFSCPHCGGSVVLRPAAVRYRAARILGDILVRACRQMSPRAPYWIIGRYRRVAQR